MKTKDLIATKKLLLKLIVAVNERVFRPDGLGHISFEGFEVNVFNDISFDEVICDICNADIVQPEQPESTPFTSFTKVLHWEQ
jgi:hypothetical protein